MNITLLHGYPDHIGKRSAWCGYGSGPTSYATGGDTLAFPRYEFYVDSVGDALSVSGNYLVRAIPSAVGPRPTWKLVWFVVSTGAQVAAGTNLSGESVQLAGFGGTY